ncbi:MAG TPA: radical SAM protein [Vicinamibacterales bacterium]|nr:radical SAM protein [Vicinamibacterales bacterium]
MPVQLPVTHSPQSGNGDSVQSFPAVLHLRREVAPAVGRPDAMPRIGEKGLPEPEFPQRPELLTNDPWPGDGVRHWTPGQIYHAMRGWAFPYVKSRILPGDFHPIVAYLFTEYKCNLDCHYCYSFDNRVKGMTEETARASIDWLHSTTCRVLALMGGEPLLRPTFVHKIVSYAAKKGFWIYIPTNGRLLKPDVIDRLADAGVATFNLAVDAVDEKPGLPKALNPIRSYFDYLVKKQYRYGYTVFLNINICRNNLDDVKQLTEIAHDNKISTDYHINEMPLLEQSHFKHLDDCNPTYITPEDHEKVDEVLDWLIARQKAGYGMTNSVERLAQMKDFMRGHLEPWNCRAGQNTVIIRVDGTLAPCFPMYSATHNWGVVGTPKFETDRLRTMKKGCEPHCFSTLNHIVGWSYNDRRVIHWLLKQARHGFQGIKGNFE